MTGKYRFEGDSRVDATLHHRLAGWIDREMQLSRLHEEICATQNLEQIFNTFVSLCLINIEIKKEIRKEDAEKSRLARREALLNCSMSYQQSQGSRRRMGTRNLSDARERNSRLLRDIERTQMNLYEEFISPPSPRFTTLQKNYWAMVKSQLPLWEQDLGFRRGETPANQHRVSQQQHLIQQQHTSRKKKKQKTRHQ